jgi:(p)ppGpp synthase/HD superfamily hydrolase
MNKGHLWQTAAAFAARAHEHQKRQDDKTPYFSHPARVTMTVVTVFGFNDEVTLAAALLHDTIEDTNTDYDDIKEEFGAKVAEIVACLTKDMRLPEKEREKQYDLQLARGPWQARLIKLADVYDNLLDHSRTSPISKLLNRADRALELTRNDKQLSEARAKLQAVAKGMRKRT